MNTDQRMRNRGQETPSERSTKNRGNSSKSPMKALRPLIKLNEVSKLSSKFSNRTTKGKSPITLLSTLDKIKPIKSQRPTKPQIQSEDAFAKISSLKKTPSKPDLTQENSEKNSSWRVPTNWKVPNSFKEFMELENIVKEGTETEEGLSGLRGSERLASLQSSFAKKKHMTKSRENLSQERIPRTERIMEEVRFDPGHTFGALDSNKNRTGNPTEAPLQADLNNSQLDSEQNITLSRQKNNDQI